MLNNAVGRIHGEASHAGLILQPYHTPFGVLWSYHLRARSNKRASAETATRQPATRCGPDGAAPATSRTLRRIAGKAPALKYRFDFLHRHGKLTVIFHAGNDKRVRIPYGRVVFTGQTMSFVADQDSSRFSPVCRYCGKRRVSDFQLHEPGFWMGQRDWMHGSRSSPEWSGRGERHE